MAGHSVLHDAAGLALGAIVDDLLDAGVNPDLQDADGWSALHLAAYGGVVALVHALLDAGADGAGATPPGGEDAQS